MAPNSQQAERARRCATGELVALLLDPRGALNVAVRAVRTIGGGLIAMALALPRIADALERLAPAGEALQELTKLQGTLDRLDQLGTFVAEELPEAQHQIETLRGQLAAAGARITELGQQMATSATVSGTLNESIRLLVAAVSMAGRTSEVVSRAMERAGDH